MSDRIAVMNRGLIEQVAGPEEVYERPTTTFVAGFIGVSNLMPGEVDPDDGASARVRLDERPRDRGPDRGRRRARRALPCRGAPGEAEDQHRPNGGGPGPGRRGHGRVLGLPGHRDADRRRPARRDPDDGARAERRRGGAPELPGRRRRRAPGWAPEHMHLVQRNQTAGREANQTMRKKLRLTALGGAGAGSPLAPGRRCGSDLGGGGREGDDDHGRGDGRGDSASVTISNWPFYIDKQDRPPSSRRSPGSRSSTSRTSTTTTSSSARSSRAFRTGESGGPQHHRRHRLDGEADVRPRLPAELRQERDPERRGEPAPSLREPSLRPRARVLRAVAERDDRAGRQHRSWRRT